MRRYNRLFLDDVETSLIYLSYRNSFDIGWVSYKVYKKRIHFILNNSDYLYIRNIFQFLVENNKVEKKKFNKSIFYRFNPLKRRDTEKGLTVFFD